MSLKRPKIPTCHPDRKHCGKGLCHTCYQLTKSENRRLYKLKRLKDKLYSSAIFLKYNLRAEDVEELLKKQNYRCEICDRHIHLPGKKRGDPEVAVIDHDHKCCAGVRTCGKCVRGLICQKCNWGLGAFLDDPITLLRAIEYLIGERLNDTMGSVTDANTTNDIMSGGMA